MIPAKKKISRSCVPPICPAPYFGTLCLFGPVSVYAEGNLKMAGFHLAALVSGCPAVAPLPGPLSRRHGRLFIIIHHRSNHTESAATQDRLHQRSVITHTIILHRRHILKWPIEIIHRLNIHEAAIRCKEVMESDRPTKQKSVPGKKRVSRDGLEQVWARLTVMELFVS